MNEGEKPEPTSEDLISKIDPKEFESDVNELADNIGQEVEVWCITVFGNNGFNAGGTLEEVTDDGVVVEDNSITFDGPELFIRRIVSKEGKLIYNNPSTEKYQ
jgi:hypothetical protein